MPDIHQGLINTHVIAKSRVLKTSSTQTRSALKHRAIAEGLRVAVIDLEHQKQDKARALLAYAIDIEAPDTIDRDALNLLVDGVCEDESERARLVSMLSVTQNPQLPDVILELLGSRLDRLRDALETADDMDAVYGVWGQRTSGGAVLASVGFTLTGVVTGGWAILAIGASLIAGGATSYGRDRLKRRARRARRAVEQAERLVELLKRKAPENG